MARKHRHKESAACVCIIALTLFSCRATNDGVLRRQEPKAITIAIPSSSSSPPNDAALVSIASDSAAHTEVDAGCTVIVGDVLSANVYSGVRDSPARLEAKRSLDPNERANWDARDHGVTYLICEFAIRMNGHAFTYEHEGASNVGAHHDHVEPSECKTDEMRREALQDVVRFTRNCSDPHAGAYWGFDLKSVDKPPSP